MTYHRPSDLASALALVASAKPGEDQRVVAGGTDIFPAARRNTYRGQTLDITGVADLRGISRTADGLRIGAATTWTDIIRADLPAAFDGLKAAARQVGSVQIQNVGTIAGNLCNASPAADGVPPLLTLNASVELRSAARGTREVPLGAFLKGVRSTDRRDDELVTAVTIPPLPTGATSSFEKLGSRHYLVISISMVAALVQLDSAGTIAEARIAVGACSPVAQRLTDLEADCIGKAPAHITVTADHLAPLSPIDDVRGTGSYRMDAVAEQCKRALIKACT